MTTKAQKQADRETALETIRRYVRSPIKVGERLPNGHRRLRPTVYATVTHVSKSGMSRDIRFYVVADGKLVSLTWAIGTLIGCRVTDKGVRVSGCGMDMRFWALDALAHILGGDFTSGNDFRIESI
jgi:hypothetical protein